MGGVEKKTIIVRGIGDETSPGTAIALAFAREGANLALVGASSSRLKAIARLASEHGVECLCLQQSLDDIDGIGSAIEGIVERFGRIDGLVNAALVAKPQLLEDTKPAELETCFRICTEIPFAWMQACLPYLAKHHGFVISLGSRFAQEGTPGYGVLAAATQGFQALNLIAAQEWEELGVSTNIVQATARNAQLRRWESEFDLPFGEASDDIELRDSYHELVELCLRLASEEGHAVTGQTLSVW